MSRRERTRLDRVGRPNPGNRSGAFSLDGDQEDDGSLGNKPFVALWTGVLDLAFITTAIPPATLLTPMYFDDLMPYSWR